MCGIYGGFGPPSAERRHALEPMGLALTHRGPDDGGQRSTLWGTIGMRRLSIIDLSHGSQPMLDATQRYSIVFNGEIYNYQELRDELRREGYPFRTQSDTEVVLAGYTRWGEAVLDRLSGMFAFCVLDESNGHAFFARDHAGKKPLYFWRCGEELFFASEIKAFAADPRFKRAINQQALAHYLTLKHVPAPFSIFPQVEALPAGHAARYDGSQLAIYCYAQPRFDGISSMCEEDAAEYLLELLRNAVRARMFAADVPVGAYLSGGLDSSLIAALAVEASGNSIHTFSMGYKEEVAHKGDMPFARRMAALLGTQHHELFISADDVVSALPAVVRAFDEPFAGTMSPYFLTELIARFVKVAVSGDGADELFGSYAAHRAAAIVAARRAGQSSYGTFDARRSLIDRCATETDALWRTRFMAFTDAEKLKLMPASCKLETTADFLSAFYTGASGDLVNRTLEVETRTLLPDGVLTYVDRLSMAHSVEVRAPFLDRSVIEFAASLPGALKVRENATKSVLRRAARKVLPQDIIERPKVGFVLPLDAWLSDRLDGLVEATTSTDALSHGFFDRSVLMKYVDEQRAGTADHTYKIWTVVMFQLWYDAYVGQSMQVPA